MIDFYNYDLSELKQDLASMVRTETENIEKEKEDKIKSIQSNFKRIMGLPTDHLVQSYSIE